MPPPVSVPYRSCTTALYRLAVLFALSLSGCSSAMNTPTAQDAAPDRPYTGTVADWPLFFRHLYFQTLCFETQWCSIRYSGFEFGNDGPTSSAPSFPDEYENVLGALYGPVPRTVPPAQVRWRSKDGSELQAEVDIAEIFRDGLIRHNVKREDIPEEIGIGNTHIILEIDDRTINVYTRTHIPLRHLRIPGNRYSDFANDLIKVYSHTY